MNLTIKSFVDHELCARLVCEIHRNFTDLKDLYKEPMIIQKSINTQMTKCMVINNYECNYNINNR